MHRNLKCHYVGEQEDNSTNFNSKWSDVLNVSSVKQNDVLSSKDTIL